MILQDTTTGKKIVVENITLEDIKGSANLICRPNQHFHDRVLKIVIHDNAEIQEFDVILEKEMSETIERHSKLIPNLNPGKTRFIEAFIPGLGKIKIIRNEEPHS